jgi:hypothetical protein
MRFTFPRFLRATTTILGALAWAGGAYAGELDRASSAVHGDDAKRPTRSSTSSGSSSRSRASDSASDQEATAERSELLVRVLTFPWSAPYLIIEEDKSVPHTFSFHDYPYAQGAPGYLKRSGAVMVAEAGDAPTPVVSTSPRTKEVAGQLRADESYLTSNVLRTSAAARLLLPYRLELDTDWLVFVDPNASSTNAAGLGSAHFGLRFAQTERVVFRTGLGTRHWIDHRGAEHGADLLYGVDIFWGRPVTTTLEGQLGFVGSAFVGRVRATIGAMLGPIEAFVGYDHVGITGRDASAALGGPVLGLRVFL